MVASVKAHRKRVSDLHIRLLERAIFDKIDAGKTAQRARSSFNLPARQPSAESTQTFVSREAIYRQSSGHSYPGRDSVISDNAALDTSAELPSLMGHVAMSPEKSTRRTSVHGSR